MFIYLVILLFFENLNADIARPKTSLVEFTNYPDVCRLAAKDEKLFSLFRSNSTIMGFVETVSYSQGLEYEKIIKEKYSHFIPLLDKIFLDDRIGLPSSHSFSLGYGSATTLRYIKVAGDLLDEFPNINNFKIVEIGGGYGGQCRILKNLTGFYEYSIIDLSVCLPLISKYLQCLKLNNVKLLDSTNLDNIPSFDLLISNYAISEIDQQDQLKYLEKIINYAPNGYITYNYSKVKFREPIEPFSLEEFISKLANTNRIIKVIPENPQTGYDNQIIIWHSKKE